MTDTIHLGVNIDHVATLRQARGTSYPDPLDAAKLAILAGASSITAHLREDRRHIQDEDIRRLKISIDKPLNLEMALTDEMVSMAITLPAERVCLVPERREELTTEGGLDVVGRKSQLRTAISRLQETGCQVSLFIDPEFEQVEAAQEVGAPVVELHTGAYADAEGDNIALELARLRDAATHAAGLGLVVHAGHGLTTHNVGPVAALPEITELNIGHWLVSRAVFVGLDNAVKEMLAATKEARG